MQFTTLLPHVLELFYFEQCKMSKQMFCIKGLGEEHKHGTRERVRNDSKELRGIILHILFTMQYALPGIYAHIAEFNPLGWIFMYTCSRVDCMKYTKNLYIPYILSPSSYKYL